MKLKEFCSKDLRLRKESVDRVLAGIPLLGVVLAPRLGDRPRFLFPGRRPPRLVLALAGAPLLTLWLSPAFSKDLVRRGSIRRLGPKGCGTVRLRLLALKPVDMVKLVMELPLLKALRLEL